MSVTVTKLKKERSVQGLYFFNPLDGTKDILCTTMSDMKQCDLFYNFLSFCRLLKFINVCFAPHVFIVLLSIIVMGNLYKLLSIYLSIWLFLYLSEEYYVVWKQKYSKKCTVLLSYCKSIFLDIIYNGQIIWFNSFSVDLNVKKVWVLG